MEGTSLEAGDTLPQHSILKTFIHAADLKEVGANTLCPPPMFHHWHFTKLV